MPEAYVVATTRTAGGRRGGRLSGWQPTDLAVQVLDALVARSAADPARVPAKWWLPDDVVFVESLPHTATGKLLKTKLREQFGAHRLP